MKWLNLLFIGVVAFAFNACEKHSASELYMIQLPNEKPAVPLPKKEAPETAAPSQASKPAPGYMH